MSSTSSAIAGAPLVLLAADRRSGDWDVGAVARPDFRRRGAVCTRPRRGLVRRAEPGPAGPLILEARSDGPRLVVEVWGSAQTAEETAEEALRACAAWVGAADDVEAGAAAAAAHPLTARLWRAAGPVRLATLPRVGEALGRAIIAQLVQSLEAAISTAQVAAAVGTPARSGLWCWPSARQIGSAQHPTLRRCGVSGRAIRALHAGAVEDRRLEAARSDPGNLDARLRQLPGVGVWTSAETRLALGDPDAVSVGDYHLPSVVGTVLTGEQRPRTAWTDVEMVELLAPFAGQRGRIIRLCERAAARRLAPRPARRAPRAALSAHRYW
jgi:3-methyladenine DNA glycosylase/8-oxoguanine DNA glycosylase